MQNLAFGKEERTNVKRNHAAHLSYQRELLELHELLHINPHLEVNFKCKKNWKYLIFSGFSSGSINLRGALENSEDLYLCTGNLF